MSCSAGRGVCSAACCLPGICFCRRSLAALHPRSLHIRNRLAETASEITSWLSRQSAALSSACLRTRITFVERLDISMLRITSERPAGVQNHFLTSTKTVGANVWVTESAAMQSQSVAMETVIESHYVLRSNSANRSGGGTRWPGRS